MRCGVFCIVLVLLSQMKRMVEAIGCLHLSQHLEVVVVGLLAIAKLGSKSSGSKNRYR